MENMVDTSTTKVLTSGHGFTTDNYNHIEIIWDKKQGNELIYVCDTDGAYERYHKRTMDMSKAEGALGAGLLMLVIGGAFKAVKWFREKKSN